MGQFNADRGAQFQALGAQGQALQGGLGALNQQGNMFGMQGDMFGQLGDLADQEQRLQYERLNAMDQAGMKQRGLQQAGLDQGYQDFLNQRDYDRNNLSWMGGILGGFPNQQDTTQNFQSQQPNFWQNAFTTGIAGLGMYNQMQG